MEYNADYFDGKGSNYIKGYNWHQGWLTKAMNLELCFKPTRVLVCGCAKGFLVEAFTLRGIEAEGFDISLYALSLVPAEIMERIYYADVCDLGFIEDNEYDLVVIIDVLEHIAEEDVDKAVSELVRVCSKHIFTRQHLEWNARSRADKTHKTIKPAEWWINIFNKYGAQVVTVPDEFLGTTKLKDEVWEDPDKEPFNPHEIIVYKVTKK